jgi:uncharacterized protein YcaQ
MNEPIHLSNQEARRFLLAKQGLWPPRALSGMAGVLAVFDRLACIQFDPLNIVARNPDLVLQSRVADYRPEMLYELAYAGRLQWVAGFSVVSRPAGAALPGRGAGRDHSA